MDKEDYPSDSDQTDEDFCPENVESDDVSEEESDGDCEESDEEQKKAVNHKVQRNRKKRSKLPEKQTAQQNKVDNLGFEKKAGVNNEEEEKKRSDALWADFLSDVNGSSKQSTSNKPQAEVRTSHSNKTDSIDKTPKDVEKVKITETFEFAGEEIKVTRDVPVDEVIEKFTTDSTKAKLPIKSSPVMPRGPAKRPAGGLSSVLSTINKKNKISVLEKSKLDWDSFKQREGINEELQTFNKGRDGYLEKQEFLERTDLRQFEIEKGLRQSKRSNR